MQIERIVTYKGAILRAEQYFGRTLPSAFSGCAGCYFDNGSSADCKALTIKPLHCSAISYPDMRGKVWRKIGTMPKVGK